MQGSMWPVVVISVVAAIVVLGSYVFCFVFAISKRHLSSRASNLALCAIGVFLLSWLIGRFGPFLMMQAGTSPLAVWVTAFSLFTSILSAVGFVLLIVAVFIDREPRRYDERAEFLPGDQRAAPQESNPYVASPVDSK